MHPSAQYLSGLLAGSDEAMSGSKPRGRGLSAQASQCITQLRMHLAIGVLGCVFAVNGQCQVYVGSSGGSVVLSNFASDETPVLLLPGAHAPRVGEAVQANVARSPTTLPLRGQRLKELVESVAQSVDIAPELIHAVISAESSYNASAVSPKGAMGLMQLMPATARRFGVKDPFLPQDNVLGGASYLKWLMGFFNGDVELALAGYNAGEQAVVRAGHKIPNYPETKAYVRRIMADLRSTNSLPL